jgi:hypothetical protein
MAVRFVVVGVGEKDTIVRYLDLIESVVAEGKDPIASTADIAELRASSLRAGSRPAMRVRPEDLRRLKVRSDADGLGRRSRRGGGRAGDGSSDSRRQLDLHPGGMDEVTRTRVFEP